MLQRSNSHRLLKQFKHTAAAQRRLAWAVEALENRVLLSGVALGTPITTFLHESAASIAVADFNGDGKMDVVASGDDGTSGGIDGVAVLLGNGDGTFQAPIFVSTGAGSPMGVATADFNGDGFADIVTINNDGSVSVILGNGNGTFQPAHVCYNVDFDPHTLTIGDFNGHPDIAIADTPKNSVIIMLGNGDGTFSTNYENLSVGGYPDSLAVGDFNGNPDLVVGELFGSGVVVELSDGQGNFTSENLSDGVNATQNVQVGDFNNDGLPDIVATTYSTQIVFSGLGDGSFQSPVVTTHSYAYSTVASGDLNGDGNADLVEIDSGGTVGAISVALGQGDGTFGPQIPLPAGGSSAIIADMNGDGKSDLVVGSDIGSVTVLLYGGATANPAPVGGNSAPAPVAPLFPIQVTSQNVATFYCGETAYFEITTNSSTAVSIGLTSELPAGLTFTDNGNGTASISGTPGLASVGDYLLNVLAVQGRHVDTQLLTLDIVSTAIRTALPPGGSTSAGGLRITSADSAQFITGHANLFTVTTTADLVLWITGELPPGINFSNQNNGTAILSGHPGAGIAGTYVFTVMASNGTRLSATQQFTLVIASGRTASISGANHASSGAGSEFSTLFHIAGYPTPSISTLGDLPQGFSLADNGDGTASLVGNSSIPAGKYTITIGATNGRQTVQKFTLTLDQPAQFSSAKQANLWPAAAGTVAISTSGYPMAQIKETGRLPAGLHFRSFSNGTAMISGTPAARAMGTYPLVLTASGGKGDTAVQTFMLTVGTPALNIATPAILANFSATSSSLLPMPYESQPSPASLLSSSQQSIIHSAIETFGKNLGDLT